MANCVLITPKSTTSSSSTVITTSTSTTAILNTSSATKNSNFSEQASVLSRSDSLESPKCDLPGSDFSKNDSFESVQNSSGLVIDLKDNNLNVKTLSNKSAQFSDDQSESSASSDNAGNLSIDLSSKFNFVTQVLKDETNLKTDQDLFIKLDTSTASTHSASSTTVDSTKSFDASSIHKSTLIKSYQDSTDVQSNDSKLLLLNQLANHSINLNRTAQFDLLETRCCAEDKNRIRKDLHKWSKATLMFVGLQRVALDLMGVEQWRELFGETNCLEKSNDEPVDWQSNEFCSLCKSTNSQSSINQSSTGSSELPISNQSSSTNFLSNLSTALPSPKRPSSIRYTSNVDSSLLNLSRNQTLIEQSLPTMTTPITMTNNSITDSDHLNSMNALISNENMTNQNESDQPELKIESTDEAISECALSEEVDYSSLLDNSRSCMNNDLIELDNSSIKSIKSETLSNGSIIDQSQTMTISESKPNLNLLSNLLTSDMPTPTTSSSKLNSMDSNLLEQLISHMNQSTSEQPLDLSLSSRKEFDFNDFNLLSSMYSNNESLAGKIKKTRIESAKKHSYTKEELGKALDDIQSGRLGTRRAATLYKIPRSTLRNKIHKMNNGDKKLKPITQLITKADDELIDDLGGNDESKSDHSPANDSLRELLKKNITSKAVESSTNLTWKNSDQLNSELQQFISGLSEMNSLNNNLLDNSLLSLNETTSYLDTMNNTNLINNALTYQLLNQQSNSNLFSSLIDLMRLIKPDVNNNLTDNRLDLLNDQLGESMNSVLSGNSVPLLKINDQLTNHPNDEDTSILDDRSKMIENLQCDANLPNDEHNTDDSNVSLTVLDDQIKSHQDMRRRSTNLNESINSNSSLNLATNPLLFSTLNLMNNGLNTGLNNQLNQLSLAGLTNLNNQLSSFNNLNNLQLINMQSTMMQTKQSQPNSGNDQSSSSNTSTADVDPNRKRPKRGRYRNYNKQDLDKAVKAVQRGEMSVHRAGTLFSIPHSTLEYKVKARHLLRPSKRLKKQQEAAAQVANAQLANGVQQANALINDPSKSSTSHNDFTSAAKLKNLLIGNREQDQTISMPSLLKQKLFQSASDSNLSNPIADTNLAQQQSTLASNLLQKLQEDINESNNF